MHFALKLVLSTLLGALGGLVSVSWGGELAHRIAPRQLRLAFCAMLAGIALAMLAWQ